MSGVKDKVKEKVTGAKDKVTGSSNESTSSNEQEREYEEGAPGTEVGRKEDPLTQYREKEAMTPAKEKEHEPTAVKREMTEKITEPGQTGTSPEGTAGADETGSEYEQGAAGANK
jgi:hypothetical protein